MDLINEAARSLSYLPTKRLRDLELNKQYKITSLKKVSTKYGLKIVLELDSSFDIFLPSKVNSLLLEKPETLLNLELELVNREVFVKSLGGCLLEFI